MMDLTFSSAGRTQSGHIMTAARKQALRENAAKFDLDAELKKLKA
jgi:hypothetical protein